MAEIQPFAAIRYNPSNTGNNLSGLLAPPYDVLDGADKNALLDKSKQNIVAIDLPHLPPQSVGPPAAYAHSAGLLTEWISNGTLVHEDRPALYVYHQQFHCKGQPVIRKMFIARARLVPFSEGVILPHEQTFGGPKEDRLALMKATKCNLSAVFGLFTDPANEIGQAFTDPISAEPNVVGSLDNVDNRMWVIKDNAAIDRVRSIMSDKRIYIADGHHRYGTALNYRDWVASQHNGHLPDDHPVNYLMMVLASMDDPGCLILPYHRVLANIKLDTITEAWEPGTQTVDTNSSEPPDIRLWEAARETEISLRFTNRAKLKELDPNQCAPWYDLDAACLHRYLIDELLAQAVGKDAIKIRYVKSSEEAKTAARREAGVALLVNATPMAHLRAVSEAGGLMPQKSTYFHPKLATGLTINPLT